MCEEVHKMREAFKEAWSGFKGIKWTDDVNVRE